MLGESTHPIRRQRESVHRFRDDGRSFYAFYEKMLLACPRCGGRAVSTAETRGNSWALGWFQPRTLTCSSCGHVERWQSREIRRSRGEYGVDDYFHLPYWLRMPCRYGVVYAVNEEHLAYMEEFFAANLRERRRGPHGWSNGSFISRLPTWMKRAKNRAEIMVCLEKLKRR